MSVQASGTRVSLSFTREAVAGTKPAALTTATDTISAEATGDSGAGYSQFERASGSFITDGFAAGQIVRVAGFTDTDNNADWRVANVSATVLEVFDPNEAIGSEAADVGNTVKIVLETLRTTGRAIDPERNRLESAEVRTSRQKADVRHGFQRIVGSPGFELSRESYDSALELVMANTWTAVATTGSPNMQVIATTSRFVRDAGSWITDGYRPGDVIRTTNFTNAANNADWVVTAVTATILTVYDGDSVMVDQASGVGDVAYPGKRLDIGTSLYTAFMQREFADVAQFQAFLGVAFDQMSMSIQPEAIIGGTFNLLGMEPLALQGSSHSAETNVVAPTTSPFAAFDGSLFEGGVNSAVVTGVDFTLANNRQLQAVVGSKNSPCVYEGTATVTGTLTALFEDATLFNKFINETLSRLAIKLDDTDGTNFMSIVFPSVKYMGGSMDPPQEGPVPLTMAFDSLESSEASAGGTSTATSLTIQRSNT